MKRNRLYFVLFVGACVGVVLWLALMCLKADGVITTSWPLVISGIVHLPITTSFLLYLVVGIFLILKRRHRRRMNDRRIIAQAKAAGVWDKHPLVLGGRALELKAWQDFKIKREPGEPDAHLRRRCMAAADNELANTPREG